MNKSEEKSWVLTGSIISMLEQAGVCYFKKYNDDFMEVSAKDKIFQSVLLYPEMLRHLAYELNEMADDIESDQE